jgi:hypothetical protein
MLHLASASPCFRGREQAKRRRNTENSARLTRPPPDGGRRHPAMTAHKQAILHRRTGPGSWRDRSALNRYRTRDGPTGHVRSVAECRKTWQKKRKFRSGYPGASADSPGSRPVCHPSAQTEPHICHRSPSRPWCASPGARTCPNPMNAFHPELPGDSHGSRPVGLPSG